MIYIKKSPCECRGIFLYIFLPVLNPHIIHKILDFLLILLPANEENIIRFHNNVIIQALKDRQFVIRQVDQAVL